MQPSQIEAQHTTTARPSSLARIGVIALVALLLLAGAALAGEVRLRSSAFVDPDQPVTLGDIATLTGEDALKHSGLVILDDPVAIAAGKTWFELSAEQLAQMLRQRGVNLGRLAITGAPCAVRLIVPAEPASKQDKERHRERPKPQTVRLPPQTTVRGSVAASLCGMLAIDPDELRLAIPGVDEAWLDQPRPAQRVLALPRTNPNNARLLVEVRIYDGEQLVDAQTLRVDALIRRTVLSLSESVERGQPIASEYVSVLEQWVEPGSALPLSRLDEVDGAVARRRLPAGTVLMPAHIEQPVVVKRNELVRVTAITRGVIVETEAHALADGKIGDRIPVRRAGSSERVTAVVEGRGRVVVRLD